jgi:hypothetical protein
VALLHKRGCYTACIPPFSGRRTHLSRAIPQADPRQDPRAHPKVRRHVAWRAYFDHIELDSQRSKLKRPPALMDRPKRGVWIRQLQPGSAVQAVALRIGQAWQGGRCHAMWGDAFETHEKLRRSPSNCVIGTDPCPRSATPCKYLLPTLHTPCNTPLPLPTHRPFPRHTIRTTSFEPTAGTRPVTPLLSPSTSRFGAWTPRPSGASGSLDPLMRCQTSSCCWGWCGGPQAVT